MIPRLLKDQIEKSFTKIGKSILLLGPRQSGKSTLMKSLLPDLSINLAREREYREHLTDPALIERLAGPLPKNAKIFIDEIQRLPSMLNTIQAIIDERKDLLFLLTGSSVRKLHKSSVNLLPGRILRYSMFPLLYWELQNNFNLERSLTRGNLPEIYLTDDGIEILKNYVDLYLREEIQNEAVVRNIASYARFLNLAASISGLEINYSSLASDSEIPKETIRRYFQILEDSLLLHRLAGFTNIKSKRKAVQREKIFLFDLGVRNSLLKIEENHPTQEQYGFLFEHWFILQIIFYLKTFNRKWELHYYRDESGLEIDLIIETAKHIYPIEVKWGNKYKSIWKKPLVSFAKETKKNTHAIIIYRGEHPQKDGTISIYPYELFLSKIDELII